MNDDYINKLLSQGLQGSSLNPALHQQFLEQSSLALSRSCRRRRWAKRAYHSVLLALALALGFAGGRIGRQQAQPIIAANTIEVPQDMVAWLAAGHLFTQFDLEQRAGFAYAQASQLARSVHAEQQAAQSHCPVPLTQTTKRLANLLTQNESLRECFQSRSSARARAKRPSVPRSKQTMFVLSSMKADKAMGLSNRAKPKPLLKHALKPRPGSTETSDINPLLATIIGEKR